MGNLVQSIGGVVVVVACVGSLTGCGDGGTTDKSASGGQAGAGCAPIAGRQLVVLADDKKLQAANNIVPVVQAKVATPALMAALNKASAAMTPERLIAMNKATDVDGGTSKAAADQFALSAKLNGDITRGPGGRIVIGTSNVSESQSLAFVYQLVLNAAGYDAEVRPAGVREQYEPALEAGEIHVFPEYLSTLTEFLNQKINGPAAATLASGDLDKTVAALRTLGDKRGLAFGTPAPAAAQNAFAVTKVLADKYSLKTLSDLAAKCSGKATVLAGPKECPDAAFCQPGLKNTYHLQVGRFTSLDAGGPKTKQALTNGTATVGLIFSSDAALAG